MRQGWRKGGDYHVKRGFLQSRKIFKKYDSCNIYLTFQVPDIGEDRNGG
jgi:hypothetical protein